MRKIVLRSLGLLISVFIIAAFLLTGCMEEAALAKDEPVTLEYWVVHAEGGPHYKIFEKAADIVKEKYNITVNVVSKGTAGYRELTTACAMSQSGPDLMFMWPGLADMVTSGRQGLFLSLNDLLTQEESNSLRLIDGCTDPESGDIYGVAYGYQYIAIAYNKILMDKAGIDYNNFPAKWNYDEFLEVCEELKSAGIAPFCFANKEGYFADWWHSFFIPSYVDKIEDVIPIYQDKPIYKEPFIAFCKNWKDFYQKGYYLEGGSTIGVAHLWGQLCNKDVAMATVFPSIMGIYVEALGEENVGLIEWPSMGDGKLSKANPVYGDGMGITNWTKHPKEAFLYLKTLVFNKEIVKEFIKTGNPPICDKFSIADFEIKNPEVARYLKVHNQMPAFYEGHGFWTREYSQIIEKFCNLMLPGEITIEEYSEEIGAFLK